jgi:ribose-phosphate pyrophosphokinase
MRSLVVSGSAHRALATEIARELETELTPCLVRSFPDGEQDVEIQGSVRGQAVFVVQPLGPPVGEHLLELLLIADACRRAGAGPVTAVTPYLGFARHDRITRDGQPLGARVLAQALGTGRFSQLVAVDVHSPAVAASLDVPLAHLSAVPALAAALRPHVTATSVVVAPDLGAVKLADAYASALGLPLAVVSKVRRSPTEVAVQTVVGDVRGKSPIVVDDMISTGSTADAAIDALRELGCRTHEVIVAATHGLFVGGAADRLEGSRVLRVFTTDSLPLAPAAPPQTHVVSLAPLLAEALRRISGDRALDELTARW